MTPLQGMPMGSPRQGEGNLNEDYAHLNEDAPIVEHLTVPAFLRRIPHKWTLGEIERFGHKVGRAAESCHLAYVPQVDASLGVLRSFPVPMLRRIYELLAPSHRWPQITELLPAPSARPAQPAPTTPAHRLVAMQAVTDWLKAMAAAGDDSQLRVAARVLVVSADDECRALERELEITELRQMGGQ